MSSPTPSSSPPCDDDTNTTLVVIVSMIAGALIALLLASLVLYFYPNVFSRIVERQPSPQRVAPVKMRDRVEAHLPHIPGVARQRLNRQDTAQNSLKYKAKVALGVSKGHQKFDEAILEKQKRNSEIEVKHNMAKTRLYDRLLKRTEEHQRELENDALARDLEQAEHIERKQWRKSVLQVAVGDNTLTSAQLVELVTHPPPLPARSIRSGAKRVIGVQRMKKRAQTPPSATPPSETKPKVKFTKKERGIAKDIHRALSIYGMVKLGNIRQQFETLSKRSLKNMLVYLTGWQMNKEKMNAVFKAINTATGTPLTSSKEVFWEDLYLWLNFIGKESWTTMHMERIVEEKIARGEDLNEEESELQEEVIANVVTAELEHSDVVIPEIIHNKFDEVGLLAELREIRRKSELTEVARVAEEQEEARKRAKERAKEGEELVKIKEEEATKARRASARGIRALPEAPKGKDEVINELTEELEKVKAEMAAMLSEKWK